MRWLTLLGALWLGNFYGFEAARAQETFGHSGVEVVDREELQGEEEVLEEEREAKMDYIESLLSLLSSGNANARVEAHYALLRAVEPGHLRPLTERLRAGGAPQAQVAIVEALAKIGDRRLSRAFAFELKHGTELSRRAVVSAFGKIGDDWATPLLFRILVDDKETDRDLRIRAAVALGEIGTDKARYSLRAARARLVDPLNTYADIIQVVDWAIEKAAGGFDTLVTDDEVPVGRRVELRFRGMHYIFASPSERRIREEKPWMIVCVHDRNYNISEVERWCRSFAKRENLAYLIPIFDAVRFLNYPDLNYRGERADLMLVDLIDFLGDRTRVLSREVFITGTGSGGSFVQRFAYANPRRVGKGTFETEEFLLPDRELYYPVGIKPSPFAPEMEFDLYDIAKLDLAFIRMIPRTTDSATPRAVRLVREKARAEGIMPRISWRNFREQFVRDGFWQMTKTFFFQEY